MLPFAHIIQHLLRNRPRGLHGVIEAAYDRTELEPARVGVGEGVVSEEGHLLPDLLLLSIQLVRNAALNHSEDTLVVSRNEAKK